jgi:hypothetical protein
VHIRSGSGGEGNPSLGPTQDWQWAILAPMWKWGISVPVHTRAFRAQSRRRCGQGIEPSLGADVAASWAVNVVTCRCGTYVDELEHSFRLLAVLLLLKLLPDLRDASDAPKPTNNKQQHRVAAYPGWLLRLHAALLVDAAQSRNTPYPARKSDPAVARDPRTSPPADRRACRAASMRGRTC